MAAWWEQIGDYASDLAKDVGQAAGTYVKVAAQAAVDKKTAPAAQPAANVGPSGNGGAVAVTPPSQQGGAGFWGGLPTWSKATIVGCGAVLVLAVGYKLVTR